MELSRHDVAARLAALLHLRELARTTAYAAALSLALFLVIYALERWRGGDRSRYRTRSFLNDIAYAVFYQGQFYSLLVFALVARLLDPYVGAFRLNSVSYLPPIIAFVVWWLTADFFGYWVHRWQHRSRILWAFHCVHHAPATLTFLTSYRIHLVEQLTTNLLLFVPLLILGIPPRAWLGVKFVQAFFEGIQHSDLDWRFGRLYRVVVSPTFHAIHHSAEQRHYDRNFGKILSVWDFVFGTAASDARPTRFGVDGLVMRESLVDQFLRPFRLCLHAVAPPGDDEQRRGARDQRADASTV
jgi:sterol desaturase/sphingolipid hydroxylase (fatty acid hydroxylase superfamily)